MSFLVSHSQFVLVLRMQTLLEANCWLYLNSGALCVYHPFSVLNLFRAPVLGSHSAHMECILWAQSGSILCSQVFSEQKSLSSGLREFGQLGHTSPELLSGFWARQCWVQKRSDPNRQLWTFRTISEEDHDSVNFGFYRSHYLSELSDELVREAPLLLFFADTQWIGSMSFCLSEFY